MLQKIQPTAVCSIARHVPLARYIQLTDDITSKEGTLVVGEVLNEKKVYNKLETRNSRNVRLQKGKAYVFVLGNRSALDGYVGHIPKKIAKGDVLQVLSLGGLCGACTSANAREVGEPFDIKIMGSVVFNDQVADIADFAIVKRLPVLRSKKNLIIVYGTCMNVGKTTTAKAIIRSLAGRGKVVAAAKLTGAGAMKDTLAMREAGASHILDMVDAGLASTITRKDTLAAARNIVSSLSCHEPDFIVIEVGDGIIGKYHVRRILYDPAFQKVMHLGVGCANDLAGAWALKTLASKHKFRLDIFCGPVTDNEAGRQYIEDRWHIPALNAKSDTENFERELVSLLLRK